MFCQTGQLMSQKFRNQIRRKHKQKIISELRQKYQLENQQQQQHKLHQFQQLWRQYLSKPTSVIPKQVMKYFNYLEFSTRTLNGIERVVNEVLDFGVCVNVWFVGRMVDRFQISSMGFFGKVIELIKMKEQDKISQGQTQKQSHEDKNQQEQLNRQRPNNKNDKFIGFELFQNQQSFRNQQQLILTLMMSYLNNMKSLTQSISLDQIRTIKQYFTQYWNTYIDSRGVNFHIAASLMSKLMYFKSQVKQIGELARGVISVLIDEDASPATFYLLKKVLSCCPESVGLVVLHPRFQALLHEGLAKDVTVKPSLQIIQLLVDRPDLLSSSNSNKQPHNYIIISSIISYSALLRSMHNSLMATSNAKIQGELLVGLFNMVVSISQQQSEQQPKQQGNQNGHSMSSTLQEMCTYLQAKINYEYMYEKVLNNYTCKQQNDDNIFAMLDFCVVVLYSYMCYHASTISKSNINNNNTTNTNNKKGMIAKARCQQLCDKLLNGKQLDIVELSCEHVLSVDSKRNWAFSGNLVEMLAVCRVNGMNIEGIAEKIGKVVTVLEGQQWRVEQNEKEELIGMFQKLIDETDTPAVI